MSRSTKLSRYSAVDLSMSKFMFPIYVAKTGANPHRFDMSRNLVLLNGGIV